MLSQIRQKKKKEAVRRLSQGPASSSHSQEPGQWSQTRKLSDQNKMQRRPGPLANRPVKRRHISPLDKGAYQGSATNSDQATQDSKNPRGAVRSSNKDAFSHFTSSTTNSTSTALTSSGSASGFSLSASNLQQSTGATSSATSGVFGTVFGTGVTKSDPNLSVASSSSSTNIFTRPVSGFQGFSSGNATSPIVCPAFGSSFATNSGSVDSTSTEAGAMVKFGDNNLPISSSSFVSFGGFGKAPSLSSGTVFPNASTNAATIQNTGGSATTSVTFGMHGGFSSFADINKGSDSTPVSKPLFPITVQDPTNLHGTSGMGTLQSNSSFGTKPPFEVTSQPFSNFSTARTEKSHTGTAGELGRAFAAAIAESRSKEGVDQAKITQEKTRGLGTALLTSLILRDIPESYNKNAWLKRFYSRFGEVTKVICNPSKKSATVTFKTHEAADAAKRKGKVLRPGLPPVAIFWKQGSRRSTSESDQQHDHQSADNENSAAQKRRSSPEKSKKIGLAFEQASKRNKTTEVLRDVQEYLHSLQPSQQAGEKLQVLEGVDKKLRQAFKRPSDISKAEAVVGTCKDMCPEKERYMREYQRRLSIFETIPGTGSIDENPQVNHARAVKEYDRSAADKEEPLPNELRPVPVLAMTMDYLATNIMDAGEGREGEWFDFLWNRTRGIRKDITQQHLCDPECVDLVEKTARFHIFCAHFLCEADMNSFDAKINTENLTKCHQTLKQFYVDLFKDKGITCPMEAEFRAYDILLNLNEGDILREVMTFRDEVQKSPEVRFSMCVFHAVNSNNFVRFFRLLRDASYLNACLLHRYFTQVRSKAVQTLNHSLSISNRTTAFPLKDLVDILAFENESEAGEFCTFHGLAVSEGCVNFSRSSFIEPETRFPVKRAWGLIESKRGVSVGEVVYNGPLPPPPQHQPGLSFSEDGRYVGDVEDLLSLMAKKSSPPSQAQEVEDNQAKLAPREAETQGADSAVTTDIPDGQVSTTHVLSPAAAAHVSRQSVLPQAPPKATIVYSGEEIMIFTKKLFIDVMNEMFADVTKEALDKVHCCLQLSNEITDQVCEQTVSEVITETAKSALEDEFNKKRIAEEKAASRERVSLVVQSDVTKDFVSRECARIVQEVVREVEEELLEIAREKASKRICLRLLEEEVNSELWELASQVVNEEKAERDAKLDELALRVRRLRAARYFNTWLKAYRASMHLKVLLSKFPPGAPMLTVEEQLQLLVGHKRHDMRTALIRTDIERNEVHNALEKRLDEVDRLRRQACKPLDIPTLLADTIRPQPVAGKLVPGSPVYWKLVISLPEGCRDVGELETSLVVKEKFKRGLYPLRTDIPQGLKEKVDLLSLYRAEVRTYASQTKLFGICVKACYGVLTNTEQREAMDTRQFLGASAAMFVVDERELQFNSQAARDAHVRLRRVLESKPPVPTLPVAVVLVGGGSDTLSEDTVFSLLGIQRLRNDGLISDCKLWRISSQVYSDDISRTLNSAVTWLGRHSPRSSVPKVDHLVNFIEDGLQREFAVPVAEDLALRRKAKLEQQCPEAIVELYNSVLEHLGTVASSASLQRLSWPISEFCDDDKHDQGLPGASWNSHHSLHTLHSCIAFLTLPPPPPAAVDGTWESESALCLEYALNLSPDATGLVNRVKWILDRTKRGLEDVNFLSVSPRLSASQVPWPLILDACVNFQLTPLHSNPGLAEQEVYYLSEEKERFVQPTLWRRSVSLSKEEAAEASTKCRLETLKPNKTKHTKLHESFMEVECGLDELNVSLPGVIMDFPLTNASSHVTLSAVTRTPVKECSSSSLGSMITASSERLKTALEEAKDESTRFEELLKNVLSDRDTPWEPGQSTWRKRKAQSLGESKKSPKYLEGSDAPSVDTSFSSLEERLSSLNETIKSQRRSDQFTERRLKQLLET